MLVASRVSQAAPAVLCAATLAAASQEGSHYGKAKAENVFHENRCR
ncbi:hypothetical protein HMPREF9946_01370 [Acetobacteraceae bacterium AT-5844]|nr:hypothetical protein HMPREF9946_01370 [Acetobacteraceae bacterium AT-5844]